MLAELDSVLELFVVLEIVSSLPFVAISVPELTLLALTSEGAASLVIRA